MKRIYIKLTVIIFLIFNSLEASSQNNELLKNRNISKMYEDTFIPFNKSFKQTIVLESEQDGAQSGHFLFRLEKKMDVLIYFYDASLSMSSMFIQDCNNSFEEESGPWEQNFDQLLSLGMKYPKEIVSHAYLLNPMMRDVVSQNHPGFNTNNLDIRASENIMYDFVQILKASRKSLFIVMKDLPPSDYYFTTLTNGNPGSRQVVILGLDGVNGINGGNGGSEGEESVSSQPSKNKNYIKSRIFTNEISTQYLDQVQYFDGLGRPIESIQVGITPNQKDLVTIQEYDGIGRESRTWLPAISDNKGAFVEHSTVKTKASTLNLNDANPYSEIIYENSPLNRPLEQYGPGSAWHTNKKAVKIEYLTNSLDYYIFTVDSINNLKRTGTYAANELYATKTTNEDGHISYEFKNKIGQLIVSRQLSGTYDLRTYYVYDNAGNKCYVLPPLAMDALTTNNINWNETTPAIAQYAYIYKYDNRNRCIAKKLPGADWIFYVYDKADRIIFTQDGESRTRSEWVFSIPDALGRPALTGICKNTLDIFGNPLANALVKASWAKTTNTYKGYNITGITLVTPTILSVNYYDNHEFLGLNSIPTSISYTAKTGYGIMHGSHKGLQTGTSVASLNNPASMYHTAIYYDYKCNPIQTKSTNHLNGYDYEYLAYNFTGQPTSKLIEHKGIVTQTELCTYTYDHAGRPTETKHKLNTGAEISLAKNEYDELGRLKKTARNNNASLTTTRTYDVRSRITRIAETNFWENLTYTYGSNISSMEWAQANVIRKYNYAYDNISQLLSASYTSTTAAEKYQTSYSYDKHGNIKTLERYGKITPTTYGIADKLSLTYNGNQLKNVKDNAVKISIAESNDFKDYENVTDEYAFNKNGAMTKDLNKGISEIQYNLLNLPKQMDVKNPLGEIRREYTYTAAGQKLRVIERSSPYYNADPKIGSGITESSLTNTKTTDYVANKVYENGSLKRTLISGGYIEGGEYHFFLQNHLGSTHLVSSRSVGVIQRSNYYPFGLAFLETNPAKQPYKFTEKELDNGQGIGIYDSHARQQDTHIPRFLSLDPLAEKYYAWSPYVYCYNNPIVYIDPDGKRGIPYRPNVGRYRSNNRNRSMAHTDRPANFIRRTTETFRLKSGQQMTELISDYNSPYDNRVQISINNVKGEIFTLAGDFISVIRDTKILFTDNGVKTETETDVVIKGDKNMNYLKAQLEYGKNFSEKMEELSNSDLSFTSKILKVKIQLGMSPKEQVLKQMNDCKDKLEKTKKEKDSQMSEVK